MMATHTLNMKEFFSSLDKATSELLQLISSAGPVSINLIPFANSWTAAQLSVHITKSNKAIAQALNMEGNSAERNPDARAEELKKMFLDFSVKFNSPEFIRPQQDNYEKETITEALKASVEHLKELRSKTNLSEIISLPEFGEITKLELLYFVLYHTQRHIYQLKNIFHELKKDNN